MKEQKNERKNTEKNPLTLWATFAEEAEILFHYLEGIPSTYHTTKTENCLYCTSKELAAGLIKIAR